ncbi:hypothetical protein [Nitrospira sp. Nam74]
MPEMHNSVNVVIGSGPCGVAAAKALLNRGQYVVMVDVGLTLESHVAEKIATMRRSPRELWDGGTLAEIQQPFLEHQGSLPNKYLFGSDFPYRPPAYGVRFSSNAVGLQPSFARGGLSNVWGASMLPYADWDLGGWPITEADLAPYYKTVLDWIGFAAHKDDLSDIYPLYGTPHAGLTPSSQAHILLEHLKKHAVALRRHGLTFGASRLAIRPTTFASNCVYCGLCMVGCPYGLIYESGDSLEELSRSPRFSYRSGLHVNRLHETDRAVEVSCTNISDGTRTRLTGNRVFVAAGVINTTAIVLKSLKNLAEAVELQDSQYFLIPAVMLKRHREASVLPTHTLSQLFLEIRDKAVSPYTVHLQAYTFNAVYESLLKRKLGAFARLLPLSMEKQFLDRLIVLQGYLHSSHSGQIRLDIGTDESTDIRTSVVHNAETRAVVRRVYRYLVKHSGKLGFVPMPGQLQLADVGRGFHSGGSFPMRSGSGHEFTTDCLGRPHSFRRVHAVDATVFPTIPSTTITLSAMANAYRIADTIAATG